MLERHKPQSHLCKTVYQINSDKTTLEQELSWHVRLLNSPPYSHLTLTLRLLKSYIYIYIYMTLVA